MKQLRILSSAIFSLLLLGLLLTPTLAWAGDADEEEPGVERQITLDQLPAAVKAAILEAAGENKVREIEEITRPDGSIYYEAEWKVEGKEIEISVGPDGTRLKTETDDDDDDDDGDDEGGEEHEAQG